MSPEQAVEALQMGSWRLRGHTCPQIEALVAQIEGAWRLTFGKDLKLFAGTRKVGQRGWLPPLPWLAAWGGPAWRLCVMPGPTTSGAPG